MHKNGTDEDEVTRADPQCAARKMQGALSVDITIDLYRVFFVWMMHARRKMDDGIYSGKRCHPIGRRAKRLNHYLFGPPGWPPNGATDCPSSALQCWRKVAADKTACAGHEDNRSLVFHRRFRPHLNQTPERHP
jgi:hypothetical protein